MYFRPVGVLKPHTGAANCGAYGIAVYADEPFEVGQMLCVDLYPPGVDEAITCRTRVVMVTKLGIGAPAPYDIGLELMDLPWESRWALDSVSRAA